MSLTFKSELPQLNVVAAVFVKNKKVCLFRRSQGQSLAGFWEFPGGKVEAQESNEQALAREVQEELGIDVIIGEYLGVSEESQELRILRIHAYICQSLSENFRLSDHDAFKWVGRKELRLDEVASLDRKFFSTLEQLGLI